MMNNEDKSLLRSDQSTQNLYSSNLHFEVENIEEIRNNIKNLKLISEI